MSKGTFFTGQPIFNQVLTAMISNQLFRSLLFELSKI